jgi:ATP-dependent Clp protease ATP-binding subunit ClpC
VFERFTERARQVVVLAQDEARALRHDYIGTEHILLGLLREEEGLAARILESLDITVEEVRVQVARIVGQSDEVTTGQIPFTPRAKKVLELALREAIQLRHDYVGTEHLLLGLVRESQGVAARILLDLGADAQKIRATLFEMLGSESTPQDHLPPAVHHLQQRVVSGDPTRRLRNRVGAPLVPALLGIAFGLGLLLGWLIWG